MFSVPLNCYHRFVNATNQPALLLCGTSAPNIINLLNNTNFVFNCPYVFTDRYQGQDDFFKANADIEPDRVRGLAMRRTNFIPDIAHCELPMDNRRSPGYRRVEPEFKGSDFYLWIGQHETGRYSKAHKHEACAVLVCLRGKGYSYTWPDSLGTQPWADGLGDKVIRQDYEPVGLVAAAPMSGDWFHQHFGVSKEPLRLSAWFGVNSHPQRKPGRPGEELNRFRCDRPQERRHRDTLSRGRPAPARRIRGRAESRGRALAHGREVLRNARRLSEVGRLSPLCVEDARCACPLA
jgi:hypothetical protein